MAHFQDTHLLSQVYEEILQEMGSEGGWSGEFYTPRPIIRLMIKIIKPKLGEVVLDPFVGSGGFLVESFDYIQQTNPKMGVKEWETLQRKTFYGQEKKPLPYLIGMMNLILHRILVPNLIRTNTLMEDVHNMPESQKVDVILTNPPFGGKENKSVQENYPIPMGATEGLALQYVMRRLKNGGRCGIVLPEGQILFGGGGFQAIREELLQKFNVTAIISLPQGTFAQMGAGVKTNLIFFEKTGPTKEIWFGEVEGKFTKKKTIQDSAMDKVSSLFQKRSLSDISWTVPIEEIAQKGFNLSAKNPLKVEEENLLEPKDLIQKIKEGQDEISKIIKSIEDSIT
jgi:type I restriction enzyme M protein